MEVDVQVLRVHHYDEDESQDRRITIAPANVDSLVVKTEDTQVRGRSVREVTVLFSQGQTIAIAINHADLELLESTVGAFFVG